MDTETSRGPSQDAVEENRQNQETFLRTNLRVLARAGNSGVFRARVATGPGHNPVISACWHWSANDVRDIVAPYSRSADKEAKSGERLALAGVEVAGQRTGCVAPLYLRKISRGMKGERSEEQEEKQVRL